MALAAAGRLGLDTVEELALQAPLVLPEEGAVAVQVRIGEDEREGVRPLTISSRPDVDDEMDQGEWTLHAAGSVALVSAGATALAIDRLEAPSWPPSGAEEIDVASLYDHLATLGLDYGPAFQGVRAAWEDGEELFAEVALQEEQAVQADAFCLHPVLADAALHPSAATLSESESQLPFSWEGVSVYARGARSLRVRIAPAEAGRTSIAAWDDEGAPVLSVDRFLTRPFDRRQVGVTSRRRSSLYGVKWVEATVASPAAAGVTALIGGEEDLVFAEAVGEADHYPDIESMRSAIAAGAPLPSRVIATSLGAVEALHQLQHWLAGEELENSGLIFVTRDAIVADRPRLDQAPIWGLVRSAQVEHPDRFRLVDLDDSSASLSCLSEAIRWDGSPELAIRDGVFLAPRLVRIRVGGQSRTHFDPDSTVLVVGATGGLGSGLSKHLVEQHQVRHLVLASRRGPDSPGAPELVAELEARGASVRLLACDVAQREQVQGLLADISDQHPLGAVIHAAGTLDDGVVEGLTERRLATVLGPKLEGALHLDELTQECDLSHFILFSSIAGVIGSPGQANYTAANAGLDALATHRRSEGRPALSLAWGPWRDSGMAVGETRTERWGLAEIAVQHGFELFDAALDADEELVLPIVLRPARLRAGSEPGGVPALLRSLTPGASGAGGGELKRRLTAAPSPERQRILLEAVLEKLALVLGGSGSVDPDRPFKEMGIDSLGAVDLRNRLSGALGMRLSATLVFDQPTPKALAEHLSPLVIPDSAGGNGIQDIEALEALVAKVASLDGAQKDVRHRLRVVGTSILRFAEGEVQVADGDGSDSDLAMAEASDSEVFAFLDRRRGAGEEQGSR
jgi:NAD(P)-dependent dehydrogenase (short-subunit alcohol dehydrogenase family)/acyl carrier protein